MQEFILRMRNQRAGFTLSPVAKPEVGVGVRDKDKLHSDARARATGRKPSRQAKKSVDSTPRHCETLSGREKRKAKKKQRSRLLPKQPGGKGFAEKDDYTK